MNKKLIKIIRIDPARRTIAAITMRAGKSPAVGTQEAKRIIGQKLVGFRELVAMEPTKLMVAGRLDVTESMPGWRIPGTEDTAGVSFLFGKGEGGGMTDVPVNLDWLRKRIIWMTSEYDAGDEQEAAE